jgi:hypothetical protein
VPLNPDTNPSHLSSHTQLRDNIKPQDSWRLSRGFNKVSREYRCKPTCYVSVSKERIILYIYMAAPSRNYLSVLKKLEWHVMAADVRRDA